MKRLLCALIVLITLLLPCAVEGAVPAQDGSLFPAYVMKADGDKWGYIDTAGKFAIDPIYAYAGDFNVQGIAEAAKGKSYHDISQVSFIDQSGKTVSGPFDITYTPYIQNGYYVFDSGGESIVVGEDGKVVLKSRYEIYECRDGLLKFSQKNRDGKQVYGYMDLKGKIVIPAQYQYGSAFVNGRADVVINDHSFAEIDKAGKVLETSSEPLNSSDTSEGLTSFRDKDGKSGYRTDDGKVAITPAFDIAGAFTDGFAIVAMTENSLDKRGLIDKSGNYVINPQYLNITYLGQGLYAVSRFVGDMYFNDTYIPKAIFNNKGEQLSDFLYYIVNNYKDGIASACDETCTFFIGPDGKKLQNLPQLKGMGTLTVSGSNVIKAEIDGGLSYLRKDGSVIWEGDETTPLDGGVKVKADKYRRDPSTFIRYPEVQGLGNNAVQSGINSSLKKLFLGHSDIGGGKDDDGNYENNYTVDFNVSKNKDLLTVELSSYLYPIGAAHGMPGEVYYYIDLKTGTFYKLSDLFKKGAKYADRLTSIVRSQIQQNVRINKIMSSYFYSNEKPTAGADQGFKISGDSMALYFAPYEIAPYAAGFPEFTIPYGQLTGIIDTKGAFWNSFNKTITDSKTNLIYGMEQDAADAISKTVKAYESNMVAAINQNKFSMVGSSLQKGSSLYNSQKTLVTNLYKKGIEEKLVKYDIYAIGYDNGKNEYKVFVNETVAVKYPGKDYVNNQYAWCYTAVYDSKTEAASLSKIEKW